MRTVAVSGGSGDLGGGLAFRLVRAGYAVLIGSRDAVLDLISRCGMVGLHAGPIENAVAAEALTSVLIGLNKRHKTHTGIRITGLSDTV